MSESRRKLYAWIIGAGVVFLIFGNQSFRELAGTYLEKRRLEKNLIALRSDQERLSRELKWIKQDPVYSEYLVRKNLGYVKKGEVEYRFINKEKGKTKP